MKVKFGPIKLEADINVVRKVKLALAYRFAEGKLQFQKNTQLSKRDCLEKVGVPSSRNKTVLDKKYTTFAWSLVTRDIQSWQQLKPDYSPIFLNITNKTDLSSVFSLILRKRNTVETLFNHFTSAIEKPSSSLPFFLLTLQFSSFLCGLWWLFAYALVKQQK